VKHEAAVTGLASEGLALVAGSAGAGSALVFSGSALVFSSTVVGPTPADLVEFRKCARDLKSLSAAKEHTNEERGGGRDPGVRRPGAVRGQLPARSKIFRAIMHDFCLFLSLPWTLYSEIIQKVTKIVFLSPPHRR